MTKAIKKAAMKSWQTTLIGICGAVGAILVGVYAQFDGDPATVANWMQIAAQAATSLGIGTLARDHGVTSEAAGAA